MVQTNRTILFEVINPEKVDLMTIITDVNGEVSLSDERLSQIHDKLAVSSFQEFTTKFSPTVKMLLDTEQKQVAFSLGSLGEGQEIIDLNHPDSLFHALMYLIESKKHKRYLLTEFEDMMADIDTGEKMTAFVQAVSEELIAFYTPTKDAKPEQEDASKNG